MARSKRVTTPRALGGLGSFAILVTVKNQNSSPEKRRERPRPVAWPQDPPGQYQPPPMFGFVSKKGHTQAHFL